MGIISGLEFIFLMTNCAGLNPDIRTLCHLCLFLPGITLVWAMPGLSEQVLRALNPKNIPKGLIVTAGLNTHERSHDIQRQGPFSFTVSHSRWGGNLNDSLQNKENEP